MPNNICTLIMLISLSGCWPDESAPTPAVPEPSPQTPVAPASHSELHRFCGDGIVEGAEECDDGNRFSLDGCDRHCQWEGQVDQGVLDATVDVALLTPLDADAPDQGRDMWVADARPEVELAPPPLGPEALPDPPLLCDGPVFDSGRLCGDGVMDDDEECDDGNVQWGDGCGTDCRVEICGNGRIDAGERCDDGNQARGDGCNATCQIEACGNGIIDAGEACDDGNRSLNDGCTPDCHLDVCGDGFRARFEACDDGNRAAGDGCDAQCRVERCGNGVVDMGEACDDGNTAQDDGCRFCRRAGIDQCDQPCDTAGTLGRVQVIESMPFDGGALSGHTIWVGPRLHERQADGTWHQTATLELPEIGPAHWGFGRRIAMDGQTVFALLYTVAPTLILVFRPDAGGVWRHRQSIQVTDILHGEDIDFALAGDHALVLRTTLDGTAREVLATQQRPDRRWTSLQRVERLDEAFIDTQVHIDGTTAWLTRDGEVVRAYDRTPDGWQVAPPPPVRFQARTATLGARLDGRRLTVHSRDGDGWPVVQVLELESDCVTLGPAWLAGMSSTLMLTTVRADTPEPSDCTVLMERPIDGEWRETHTLQVPSMDEPQTAVVGDGHALLGSSVWVDARPGWCGSDGVCSCVEGAAGADCSARPACGDGARQVAEACDDGNAIADDDCSLACTGRCGDGRRAPDEACDDGNREAGDGCDAVCRIECGNGRLDPGEACDPGILSGRRCGLDCQFLPTPWVVRAACGDGELDAFEDCDDGNLLPGDGCNAMCLVEVCGNGVIDAGEACDDGNAEPDDGCDACRRMGCGDGVVGVDEECDEPTARCRACRWVSPALCAQPCEPEGTGGSWRGVPDFARNDPIRVHRGGVDAYRFGERGPSLYQRIRTPEGWAVQTTQIAWSESAFVVPVTRTDGQHALFVYVLDDADRWQISQTILLADPIHGVAMSADHLLMIHAIDAGRSQIRAFRYQDEWRPAQRLDVEWRAGPIYLSGQTVWQNGEADELRWAVDHGWQLHAAPRVELDGRARSTGARMVGNQLEIYAQTAHEWRLEQQMDGPFRCGDRRFIYALSPDLIVVAGDTFDDALEQRIVCLIPVIRLSQTWQALGAYADFNAEERRRLASRHAPRLIRSGDEPAGWRPPRCDLTGACACVEGAAGRRCAQRPCCGDGVVQVAEQCDGGEGCDPLCRIE